MMFHTIHMSSAPVLITRQQDWWAINPIFDWTLNQFSNQ
jgi:hypothetical protein